MPKKMKLDLNNLNVNSFETSLVKGGVTHSDQPDCTEVGDCSSPYITKFCTGAYCTHYKCY